MTATKKDKAPELKLGCNESPHDGRDLLLSNYLDTGRLPKLPTKFGHLGVEPTDGWGMLGNDTVGDCVLAGGAHETMLFTKLGGKAATFTDSTVIGDYSAITGYTPDDPNSDQGTDPRAAAQYRRKVGLLDAKGHRHKIAAFVSITPGNVQHVELGAYLFEAVGLAFQFPQSAMDQFNAGEPWDYVPGSPIEGGHYVPLFAKDAHELYVVTWGRVQPVTLAFFQHYCVQALAYLTTEDLTNAKSPEGFDLAQLRADLAAL